jgi:site-specific recombinase XerD
MNEKALANYQGTSAIVNLVLDGLTSEHSKRAYGKALADFLAWHADQGRPSLSKALVQRYKVVLEESGLSPSTVNLRLSAVRKLAAEAADNGRVDPALANGIKAVKGVKAAGVRSGNWLTQAQAQALLNAPGIETLRRGERVCRPVRVRQPRNSRPAPDVRKIGPQGGAGLDQIQLSLAHASIKATERYLGVEQDLVSAPCDVLGLRLGT